MDYLTASETAQKWGVTRRWVLKYCVSNRIAGAMKKGNMWLLPQNAEKPEDQRKKSK